jgi:hypothetical protein
MSSFDHHELPSDQVIISSSPEDISAKALQSQMLPLYMKSQVTSVDQGTRGTFCEVRQTDWHCASYYISLCTGHILLCRPTPNSNADYYPTCNQFISPTTMSESKAEQIDRVKANLRES